MKNLLTLFFLAITLDCFPQCPFPANLDSTGNCVGTTLSVGTKDSISKIVWFNGITSVDTALANAGSVLTGVVVAGGNGGGTAPNQLFFPQGVFVDASGNIYVSDEDNWRVQKFAPGSTNGITVAGGNGFGPAANQLNGAAGIFVDASGNLYIADYGNFRIQKWAPGATAGVTVAGGNGSGAAANQFDFPTALFVDNAGNIYVADDNNNRVQEWTPGATTGITVAGGNGYGTAANQFEFAEGVFVDGNGNVYVLDDFNNRVQEWAPGATSGVTVAGGNGYGAANNQLAYPLGGLIVDASGNIYIGDSGNNRVQKWAPGATSGVTVAGGNGPGNASNQLLDPRYIFLDGSGNIYVGEDENDRVTKWAQVPYIDTTYKTTTPGNYTAVITNNLGCTITSNPVAINPNVNTAVSISSSAASICSGTPVIFNAAAVNGGASPIYQWEVNGIDSGNNNSIFSSNNLSNGSKVHCIFISDAKCASKLTDTSNDILILVNNPVTPAIKIEASQTSICAGTSVEFSASDTNAGPSPVYLWKINGNNAGTNNPDFNSTTFINGDVISCAMAANIACATSDTVISNSIVLNVSPHTNSTVNIQASANNICAGQPVRFNAVSTNGGSDPVYQWLVNGMVTGSNSSTYTTNSLNNGDNIDCIMNSSLACTSPDSSSVIPMVVFPVPEISFSPDTLYSTNNQGIQLTPIISGTVSQYQWSPASGLSSTSTEFPVANPKNENTYQLIATDMNGCSASGKITVIAGRPLEIPNAFTPNGDGRNDIFRIPPGVQFNLEELSVFDRWGNKVFTTNDIGKGWDGTYGGMPVVSGTYVYMINGKTPAGKSVLLKGTVILIR